MRHSSQRINEFVNQVEARYDEAQVESFWRCGEWITQLLTGDFASGVTHAAIQQLADGVPRDENWQPQRLIICTKERWTLSLALIKSQSRYIHTTPFIGIYVPLGTEQLHYDAYELPSSYDNAVFDSSAALNKINSSVAKSGQLLNLDSTKNVYDFKVERPTLILEFKSTNIQALEWLFDRQTLKAVQANDADLRSTQLRVILNILGRLHYSAALPEIESLTSHPYHAVRWAAIQSLGRMSPPLAYEKLVAAQSDSHPHIRRAAAKSLQRAAEV